MILHPAAIALLGGSAIGAALLLRAAWHAVAVLRGWDLASGSASQLALERSTHLVSTLVALALSFEVVALLLFAAAVDGLAPLFTGAMCAAGVLAASPWGYPALFARILVALLGGVWLVVNHADSLGEDYPLIRVRHALLLALAPLVLLEGALQARFFLSLRPEVITSCCGSLFSASGPGLGSLLAGVSRTPAACALFGTAAAVVAAGLWLRRRPGRGAGVALATSAALGAVAGAVGLVAFVSPYVYELPGHRCPFCLLKPEYRWVGYPLYAALLAGAIAGVGGGTLATVRAPPSLAEPLPRLLRRAAAAAAVAFASFAALAALLVASSRLRVGGP